MEKAFVLLKMRSKHSRMNKNFRQRKNVECRAVSNDHASFRESWKRAAGSEDFPGEWQALPLDPEGRIEGLKN